MNHRILIIGFAILLGMGTSCKRKDEPNKILDPLPLNSTQTSVPGDIAQAWHLLKRDCLVILIPVINRTTVPDSGFPELTGPDGSSQYTFQTENPHYGLATFTIRFYEEDLATVIDPILTNTSTTTLKRVTVNVTGSSPLLTYTENLNLDLEITGNVASNKRFTGSSTFNDTALTNNLVFTIVAPGARGTYEGMVDGQITATGTGPGGQPTTMTLNISASHTADGPITWEGLTGGIHIEDNGTGYIITNQYRLLLD